MKTSNDYLNHSQFVKLQSKDSFEDFRYSGKITSECLSMLKGFVLSGTNKSLKQLDIIAEEYFLDNKTVPVFKGYFGFPSSVCMSINKELVHGIPKDYYLQDGDMISFDTGCNYNGSITDSAITCIFGNPKSIEHINIINATYDCLKEAIRSININNRIGVIGNTIFHTARKKGFKIIEKYTGHGISNNCVHSDPPILNKSEINDGVRVKNGMVIAIEPLLISNLSSTKTYVKDDGWTVISESPISCHFEHSILISENNVEVLTERKNEDCI